MGRTITIKQLIKAVDLEIYAGEKGINNEITEEEIRFPWLEFAYINVYRFKLQRRLSCNLFTS